MTEDVNAKDGALITARGVETDVRVVKKSQSASDGLEIQHRFTSRVVCHCDCGSRIPSFSAISTFHGSSNR